MLDERAILAASAHFDANPARAKIAKSLADSDYTGVAWRLRHPESVDSPVVNAPENGDSTADVTTSPAEPKPGL